MKYKSLAHVTFNVSNMERTLRFYCDGLGLKYAFSLSFESTYKKLKEDIANGTVPEYIDVENALKELEAIKERPWLIYLQVRPGQFIELFYTYDNEPLLGDTSHKCGYQHICLEVEDIKAAWNELVSKGITPISKITKGPDNSFQFWIVDPDGNRIELMQYTETSLQVIHAEEE